MSAFTHDLAVIGAGPAGMTAALTAASLGLKTVLLDEQLRPGGQIYRNVTEAPDSIAQLLGADYLHGRPIAERLGGSGVELAFGCMVWDVARDLTISAQHSGRSFQIQAPQVIVATGAMERPSPIPGWTLPGVMNAGAAQIALKSSGAVPSGRVVLAGCGPLLLLVASQLLDAGVLVEAIVETSPSANAWRALAHLPAALRAPAYFAKGARMLWRVRRAGVPRFRAANSLRVEGSARVEALSFAVRGIPRRVEADLLLLHHGVIPNTQVTRLLRVAHDWDASQLAWRPRVDAWGETSLPGLRVAGDGAGIAGALAAEPSGALAALGAACALQRLQERDRNRRAEAIRSDFARQLRIRPFLDALYQPPGWLAAPSDETVVCRCEEVTAGGVREMARLGAQGPNQAKFFSRCGMGPCQGRVCGVAVTQIMASALQRPASDIGAYHVRAPLKPVPLGSIAALGRRAAGEPCDRGATKPGARDAGQPPA